MNYTNITMVPIKVKDGKTVFAIQQPVDSHPVYVMGLNGKLTPAIPFEAVFERSLRKIAADPKTSRESLFRTSARIPALAEYAVLTNPEYNPSEIF